MNKPRLLDLFCKAGGATKGYQRAGFYVVGIDIERQSNYIGDEFYRADALEYVSTHGAEFDAIHASPPCQRYTAMQHMHNNSLSHPDLIDPVRSLLIASGKPYVIENVKGSPLRGNFMLCGTMFGLPIIHHRIFETNIEMPILFPSCKHLCVYDRFHGGEMATGEKYKLSAALGIDWIVTREEARNAIPPAYTEFIGKYIMNSTPSQFP